MAHPLAIDVDLGNNDAIDPSILALFNRSIPSPALRPVEVGHATVNKVSFITQVLN